MIITADLYNTFIPGKRLATLLLTLAIGLLPILLSAQQIHDTLSINTGDNGEYAVNRHLYIYKTNNDVSPAFISESVKPAEFKQLFPANSFNDVQHPSNYYWLLLTVII